MLTWMISISILFAATVSSASVGFYSGTFDPPTPAQIKIISCALGEVTVAKECQNIGRRLSRLVVSVGADSDEDHYASVRERVLMLKKALARFGERIEVVAASAAEGGDKTRDIQAAKGAEKTIRLISQNDYQALPVSSRRDPWTLWVIVPIDENGNFTPAKSDPSAAGNVTMMSSPQAFRSLSAASIRRLLAAGKPATGLVSAEVREVIEKLGLYQDVTADLENLQRALFTEGWENFLKDLKSACPTAINQRECTVLATQWNEIPVVVEDGQAAKNEPEQRPRLIYRKSQSEDRWAEKFSNTALSFLRDTADFAKFKPIADDISARMFQDYPYGKLPHLRRVTIRGNAPLPPSLSTGPKALSCSASEGSYNMNIEQYVADRFPASFAEFIKEKLGQRLILPAGLYVHNRPLADVVNSHRRDGYHTFYFLQTRRGQLHRNIYLAVRPRPLGYRIVLTDVRGSDRRANVLCQIDRARVFSSFHEATSKEPAPLFVFNAAGVVAKFDAQDILLFGFKGNWTRLLQSNDWRRSPLVREGLDIDVFSHANIRQKIVVARNVYGDDANIVLNAFYKKGIRRFLYIGSAGAIADYEIGDVVIPGEFVDSRGASLNFRGNGAQRYGPELAKLVTIHAPEKHGWVQSLFEETKQFLLDWRERQVGSVDIEGLHLGRFAANHKDVDMVVLMVISDQTLGETTIEESNAYRDVIDASVDKLQAFFLPKVTGRKEGG